MKIEIHQIHKGIPNGKRSGKWCRTIRASTTIPSALATLLKDADDTTLFRTVSGRFEEFELLYQRVCWPSDAGILNDEMYLVAFVATPDDTKTITEEIRLFHKNEGFTKPGKFRDWAIEHEVWL